MSFDPNKYLAEEESQPSKPAFDPNEYLASEQESPGLISKYLHLLAVPGNKEEDALRAVLDAVGVPEGPKIGGGPSMGEMMDKDAAKLKILKGDHPEWMYQKQAPVSVREIGVRATRLALDPINFIAPGLGRAAGAVDNAALKILLEKSAMVAEKATNPIGTAGEAAVAGAKIAGRGFRKASELFSDLNPQEAEQYLRNRDKVLKYKDLLSDRMNIDEAQKEARSSVQNMIDVNDKAIESADRALQALHDGQTPVTADLDMLMKLKDDPKAAPILQKIQQDLVARRPMGPEFSTRTAEQLPVGGLSYPAKAEGPGVSESSPQDQEMFTAERANKPQYTDLRNDGRRVSVESRMPEQGELFTPEGAQKPLHLGDQTSDRIEGVLPEEVASNPLTQEEQLKLLLEDERRKVAQTPGSVSPSSQERFDPEQAPFSELTQEPLDLPGQNFSRDRAPITKADLRELRKRAGKYAEFYQLPGNGGSVPKNEEWGDLYGKTNEWLQRTPEEKSLDQEMFDRILTREELEKGVKNPLAFLKTNSEDARARIAAAAKRTGDTEVFDTTNQFGAARKLLGATDGNKNNWIKRFLMHAGARQGMRINDALQNSSIMDAIGQALSYPGNLPPSFWNELLKQKTQENNQ